MSSGILLSATLRDTLNPIATPAYTLKTKVYGQRQAWFPTSPACNAASAAAYWASGTTPTSFGVAAKQTKTLNPNDFVPHSRTCHPRVKAQSPKARKHFKQLQITTSTVLRRLSQGFTARPSSFNFNKASDASTRASINSGLNLCGLGLFKA